jgi:tetratricopeptide (TPR) repeat protein
MLPPYDDAVLDRAAALAERSTHLMVRASYVHLRGLAHLRAARNDAAREDFLEALRMYPPGSGQILTTRSHLGGEAARDGRVHEALAWTEAGEFHPADEPGSRARRATLLLAAGDLEAADQQLDLLELLEGNERTVESMRAARLVLGGRVEEAAVLAENACTRPVRVGTHAFGAGMVLAWVRVVQGLGDAALRLAEALEASSMLVNADYPAQVALLRVAALARAGRIDEARAALDGLEPVGLRWWPVARRVVAACVDRAAGFPVDAAAIRREVEHGRMLHVITQFAMATLEAPWSTVRGG